ncbi:unnamed protein product [Arabidopsis lyrata]|nr:unnamed protein product [Arabidopsis lyrata]
MQWSICINIVASFFSESVQKSAFFVQTLDGEVVEAYEVRMWRERFTDKTCLEKEQNDPWIARRNSHDVQG